ncbi:MAG: hypothetical protein OS112_06385 [Methanoregula sp.]|nr:MAG: hypothetical protein OS112_06385 [Methanoregula sp.]
MQKEDYQWVIFALGLLVVIALIIKPVATHEPPNFSIPELPALPKMPPLPSAPSPILTTSVITPVTSPVTGMPTTAEPTPVPTVSTPVPAQTLLVWNGTGQTVGFVDPATYNVNLSTFIPRDINQTLDKQTPYRSTNYTSILKTPITGQYSGTTQVIDIPFPYWEIWYSVDPTASDLSEQSDVSVSASGAQGSYSTTKPSFTIDVVDANNPSRFVKTITPSGSLDPALWKTNDPRPWKEKIFEGSRSYYFIITARYLASYKIDIMVPNNYLGKI